MKRCIIHIGTHKTGTSSIQASLNNFESEAFRYANIVRIPNHGYAILRAFSDSPRHQHPVHAQPTLPALVRTQLEEQLKRTEARTLIISGEGIVKLTVEELEGLKSFINQYVPDITIACYVRSPKGFTESALQELIKAGTSDINLDYCYPHYRNKIEKFDLVFGKENVCCWKFSPKTFKDRCVVSDFCEQFGIDLKPDSIIRVNEGLSKDALTLLYSYHKHISNSVELAYGDPAYKALLKQLVRLKGEKLRLSAEMMQPVLEKYSKDIEWVESRLGESVKDWAVSSGVEITSEADLLLPSEAAISWLSKRSGVDKAEFLLEAPSRVVSNCMEQVRLNVEDKLLASTRA